MHLTEVVAEIDALGEFSFSLVICNESCHKKGLLDLSINTCLWIRKLVDVYKSDFSKIQERLSASYKKASVE